MPKLARDPLALLVTVALALLAAVALSAGSRVVGFAADAPPPAVGLYELEYLPDGQPVRWARPDASLSLPNPGGPLRLELRLTGDRAASLRLDGLDLRLAPGGTGPGGLTLEPPRLELPLRVEPRRYRLLLPPQREETLTLRLSSAPFAAPGDPRALGVLFEGLTIAGGGRAPTALLLAVGVLAAGLYGLARSLARPLPAALGATGLALALLVWQRLALWPELPFWPLAAVAGLSAATATLCWPAAWAGVEQLRHAGRAPLRARWLVLAGGALAAYLALGYYNQLVVHPRLDSDLGIYLRAGETVLAGQSPYAIFGLDVIGASFFYPPATLPLFAALAGLPVGAVAPLWLVGSLILSLCALLAIYAALPGPPSRVAAVALILLGLGYGPALEGLAVGQINGLMLLGLALFILGHHERRLAWAGDVGIAVVILIKLTPGVLLLWPLLRGDWRRLVRVAVAGVLLCLPSLLLYGIGPWLEFVRLVPDLLRGVPRNPFNQSVVGVLTALSPRGSWLETAAAWAGRGASLLLLAGWAAICLRRRQEVVGPALAFGVTVLTIASSLIWYHHLTFLTIPLAWLAFGGGRRERIAALVALGLIQSTRLIEFGLGVPPVTAMLGYLIVAAALAGWLLGGRGTAGDQHNAAPESRNGV